MPAAGDRLVGEPIGVNHILVNATPIRLDGCSAIDNLDRLPADGFASPSHTSVRVGVANRAAPNWRRED
jgi:hypothetical protein